VSPKIFDRYFLVLGIGNSRKLRPLTDSEFRAHVAGVLALAAQSPKRGFLLITDGVEVTAEDVSSEAGGGVTPRIAASAMQKLKDRGVLVRDAEVGAWYVHDWHEVNPDPREDRTNAERQKRHRDKQRNGDSNATVTPDLTACNADEVEVEVEVEAPANAGGARKRATRRVDQSVLPADFPEDKRPAFDAISPILLQAWDLRGGIKPEPRGVGLAIMRNAAADHVAIARRLEHWLTAGNGTRYPCRDVAARFGDWVAEAPASSNVTAISTATEAKATDVYTAAALRNTERMLGRTA
jgi:hypothetical protein